MRASIGRLVHYYHCGDSWARVAFIQHVTDNPEVVDLRVLEYGADMEDFFAPNVRMRGYGESIDNGPFWEWPTRVEA